MDFFIVGPESLSKKQRGWGVTVFTLPIVGLVFDFLVGALFVTYAIIIDIAGFSQEDANDVRIIFLIMTLVFGSLALILAIISLCFHHAIVKKSVNGVSLKSFYSTSGFIMAVLSLGLSALLLALGLVFYLA
jgi:hypothetical protein